METQENTPVKVQAYQCSVCGSLHKRSRSVQACMIRHEKEEIKEKARQGAMKAELKRRNNIDKMANSVRLEAENFEDIFVLLKKYAKEYMDVDISFSSEKDWYGISCLNSWRFGNVSNTHNRPIGGVTNWGHKDKDSPTSYLGWNGRFVGKIVSPKTVVARGRKEGIGLTSIIRSSFSNTHFGFLFEGFNTSGGSFGNPFDGSGCIFLDDFPKLKAKHDQLVLLEKQELAFKDEIQRLYTKSMDYFNKIQDQDAELQAIYRKIKTLEDQVSVLRVQKENKVTELGKREAKTINEQRTPASSFNYDKDLLVSLKEDLKCRY